MLRCLQCQIKCHSAKVQKMRESGSPCSQYCDVAKSLKLLRTSKYPKIHVTSMECEWFYSSFEKLRSISPILREIVVDKAVFRMLIPWSIPEIFAIKVWICLKSGRILAAFALQNFAGAGHSNVVPKFSCLPRGTSRGKFLWIYSPWPQSYYG